MDECIRNYRNEVKRKLKNLHSSNPKEYWKILNEKGNLKIMRVL